MIRRILLAAALAFLWVYPAEAGWFIKTQPRYVMQVGRTEAVYNVDNAIIATGSGKKATIEQARAAIVQAAAARQWTLSEVDPGHFVATVHVRTHMAQVDITYSTEHYSIKYKNSDDLLYNGSEIHRNYNKWVKILQNEINKALAKY